MLLLVELWELKHSNMRTQSATQIQSGFDNFVVVKVTVNIRLNLCRSFCIHLCWFLCFKSNTQLYSYSMENFANGSFKVECV